MQFNGQLQVHAQLVDCVQLFDVAVRKRAVSSKPAVEIRPDGPEGCPPGAESSL
jgi:hypothetical protein